jgi:hypothetical protein
MVWLSLELEALAVPIVGFMTYFVLNKSKSDYHRSVILALVLYSLNTRPSLKAMLKYEGCERLLIQ